MCIRCNDISAGAKQDWSHLIVLLRETTLRCDIHHQDSLAAPVCGQRDFIVVDILHSEIKDRFEGGGV